MIARCGARPRAAARLPFMALGSVALAVLLAACDRAGDEFAVGTLERDRIEVAADSGEPIAAIQVREGDPVAVGDLLLQQDSVRLDAQLRAAEAERALAVARLQEAENGPLIDSIERARALLAETAAAVRTAEAQLTRARSLRARDFASAESIDVLQGNHDAALARQAQARELLAELEAGTRWEILAQLRATVAAVEARIDELRILLDRARVRAPVDGVVEALPFEPGERPQPGQTVVVLRAGAPTYARIHLPEALRARLAVGDAALVRLDGHAGEYRGRVRWIAGEAAFTPYYALTQHDRGRLSYLAEVALEPGDAVLPAGVPVEVRFPARP